MTYPIVTVTFARPEGGTHKQRVRFGAWEPGKVARTIAKAAKIAAGKGVSVANMLSVMHGNTVIFDYLGTSDRFRR